MTEEIKITMIVKRVSNQQCPGDCADCKCVFTSCCNKALAHLGGHRFDDPENCFHFELVRFIHEEEKEKGVCD